MLFKFFLFHRGSSQLSLLQHFQFLLFCRSSQKSCLLQISGKFVNLSNFAFRIGLCRLYIRRPLVFFLRLLVIFSGEFLIGNGNGALVRFFLCLLPGFLACNKGVHFFKHRLRIAFSRFYIQSKGIIIPGPDKILVNVKTVCKAYILFVIFLGLRQGGKQTVYFNDLVLRIVLVGFDLRCIYIFFSRCGVRFGGEKLVCICDELGICLIFSALVGNQEGKFSDPVLGVFFLGS